MAALAFLLSAAGLSVEVAIGVALIAALVTQIVLAHLTDERSRREAARRASRNIMNLDTDEEFMAMPLQEKIDTLQDALRSGVAEGLYTQAELEEWTRLANERQGPPL